MKKNRSIRGSALLISLVIVVIAAGIGGAFLAQSLIHSKEQTWSIEADEAFSMCDAGMERARQALGAYKADKANPWQWKDIATYCGSRPMSGVSIKAEALTLFKSSTFALYTQTIYAAGTNSAVAADNGDPNTMRPANTIAWSGADTFKALFANSLPFHRGSIYINVTAPPAGATPVTGDYDNLIVTVTATMQSGLQRSVEGVLSKPSAPLKINGLAAVVSNDDVSLNGSITIDGRDHDYAGKNVTGSGVFGIISNSPMSDPTNGSVGGNGQAPPNPKGSAPGSVKGSYSFNNGYPTTPDSALSMADGSSVPDGALKQNAKDAGTYFSTQAQYDAFISANGGRIPDASILYLEFTPGNGQFNLGSGNSKSSILIVHTDAQSGIVKEVHGDFTGLILADGFVRNNGNSHITGMVQLFSPTASTAGNVFGNGNAEIDFSSAALADLPGMSGSNAPAKLVSFRRIQ